MIPSEGSLFGCSPGTASSSYLLESRDDGNDDNYGLYDACDLPVRATFVHFPNLHEDARTVRSV